MHVLGILGAGVVDDDEGLVDVVVVVDVGGLLLVEGGAHKLGQNADLVFQPTTFFVRGRDDVDPRAGLGRLDKRGDAVEVGLVAGNHGDLLCGFCAPRTGGAAIGLGRSWQQTIPQTGGRRRYFA